MASTPEFLAYVEDDASRQIVSDVAAKTWPSAEVKAGGVAEAMAFLSMGSFPQALLIDFSKSKDAEADAKALREIAPSTTLLGLGAVNDVQLFRKLLAAGVSDYIVKPLNAEMLQQAIISAAHFGAGEEKAQGIGELVVIIGSRGGVGASTLAVNTSWILAEEKKLSVALVDLDIHYGTSALALDVEPSPGLREALKNPSRIDSLFVTSALVKATERLYVLGSEEPLDEEITPDPTAMQLLLSEMRSRFQIVVVDLPRHLIGLQDTILGDASKIFLVSDLSLAGIRDTVRLLSKIKQTGTKADIRLIANRTGATASGIGPADFERGTETKVAVSIPDDVKIMAAANAGKPLATMSGGMVSSPAKSISALRDLANLMCGKAQPEGKKEKPKWALKLAKK